MSFHQDNKKPDKAWRKSARPQLLAAGLPDFILDDDRRWNYVMLHGDDELESGWSPTWISKDQATAPLHLLRSHYAESSALYLFDSLKKRIADNMSKKPRRKFKVLFVAGFGPIVRDVAKSRKFYADTLGLSFEKVGDYLHTQELEGVKHFALWSLSEAAQSCFGSQNWPAHLPVPQAWLEFDVDDIEQVGAELEKKGYTLLTRARKEPWGQTVTRLLSPEGILVAVTVTPAMRE